jgi:predicted nucleic acid-binding protein
MTAYLDASALVKLVTSEDDTDALRAFLATRPSRATSIVAIVEVRRAVLRRAPAALEAVSAPLAGVAVLSLDEEIAGRAGLVEPATLRTLDAIHLASAETLGADLEAFVTYDERLATAARAARLPVASPSGPGSG